MTATITPADLAARYAALPESIREKCPRPLVNVTPAQVHAWLVSVRAAVLAAAANTCDVALTIVRDGDVDAAESLRAEAANLLAFARDLGDLMGLPAAAAS